MAIHAFHTSSVGNKASIGGTEKKVYRYPSFILFLRALSIPYTYAALYERHYFRTCVVLKASSKVARAFFKRMIKNRKDERHRVLRVWAIFHQPLPMGHFLRFLSHVDGSSDTSSSSKIYGRAWSLPDTYTHTPFTRPVRQKSRLHRSYKLPRKHTTCIEPGSSDFFAFTTTHDLLTTN